MKHACRWFTLLLIVNGMVLVSGCLVRRDSPAPGCVEYWGISPLGGCQGKTVIQDLQTADVPDCLTVDVNNCNGGVLEVDNACGKPVVLDGVPVDPMTSVSLDVVDSSTLTVTYGNFSSFVPEHDVRVNVRGQLSENNFTFSFTKTTTLCP
ncbi:MAG: hypothetical protein ACP5HM_04470 [Anaerolineae bacterium]